MSKANQLVFLEEILKEIKESFPTDPIPIVNCYGDNEGIATEDFFQGKPWIKISYSSMLIADKMDPDFNHSFCICWLKEEAALYYLPAFLKNILLDFTEENIEDSYFDTIFSLLSGELSIKKSSFEKFSFRQNRAIAKTIKYYIDYNICYKADLYDDLLNSPELLLNSYWKIYL